LSKRPKVSIGLPVYNEKRYLRESLDCLLGQSFTDFELIICDNASTDCTEDICREYAKKDSRIKYFKNDRNIGGSPNHNKVVQLSFGEYFMWAAGDDIRHRDSIREYLNVLENDRSLVLCYANSRKIDEYGMDLPAEVSTLDVSDPRPNRRFQQLIDLEYRMDPAYGLIRLSILKKTQLEGQYADSDRVLLAELGLHGRFHRLDAVLFFRREHPNRSINVYSGRRSRTPWFDPDHPNRWVFPYSRQFFEMYRAIGRVRIGHEERWACYRHLADWGWRYKRRMASDYTGSIRRMLRQIKRLFASV